MRIAFVVQRYGPDVHGGSEQLCRAWAERLAHRHAVTVFTTCARDYLTWADHYPPGEHMIAGVRVRRFPVDAPRDLAAFDAFSQTIFGGPHSPDDELEWMRRQGPYSTPLLAAIAAAREDHDLFVFMTYLYCTTYFGLPLVAERAALVPTAHDEPFIYLALFRRLFALPRALLFLTPAEQALVQRIFDVTHIPAHEARMGLDLPAVVAPAVAEDPPMLLYIGRVHPSKAVDELQAFFTRYRAEGGRPARLVFAGRVDLPLPAHPEVESLGFVDEATKQALLARACLVLMPSYYESLSISVIEAWAAGRPTLVNGAAMVLREQSLRGGGGLFYQGYHEFAACLDRLLADEALRRQLAAQGRAFVMRTYSWPVAEARLEQSLASIVTGPNRDAVASMREQP
jgi:glycosyltransferase involved in cell wall biosynthesis